MSREHACAHGWQPVSLGCLSANVSVKKRKDGAQILDNPKLGFEMSADEKTLAFLVSMCLRLFTQLTVMS